MSFLTTHASKYGVEKFLTPSGYSKSSYTRLAYCARLAMRNFFQHLPILEGVQSTLLSIQDRFIHIILIPGVLIKRPTFHKQ